MRSKFLSHSALFLLISVLASFFYSFAILGDETANNPSDAFNAAIIADWERQESRLKRGLESPEALRDLIARVRTASDALADEELAPADSLQKIRALADEIEARENQPSPDASRREDYLTLRWALRDLLFSNELLPKEPLLFMKRNEFVCQMLHEYLSYFYRYGGIQGGGIYRLKNPGRSFETEDLTAAKFPRGTFSTMALSYDAKTLYFSFADLSSFLTDDSPVLLYHDGFGDYSATYVSEYMKEEKGKFHLYKMDLESGSVTQLTDGPDDDFDPCPLPDGGLAFMSTRRGGFGRCHGQWEPLPVHTLHRLDADGQITCLSWHETNEWQPSVIGDGRIVYTRWDYVDRNASRHHGLWLTNPDGTGAVSLFGNYTVRVCALYQAKAIPNSKKILFVAGAHHLNVGGPLVLLDPTKVHYNPENAEDELDCLDNITPEVPYPESPDEVERGYDDEYYYSPYPLSEDYFLTAYSPETLGGMHHPVCVGKTGKTGLYYRDRWGNLELLYEDADFSCHYPIPQTETETPPVIPPLVKKDAPKEGTLLLSNVYESLVPFPEGRKVKEIRVFQILPKFPNHLSNGPKIGHANAENARLLIGTTPVEEDGSAHFIVPAEKPLYFQAVDEEGKAIQSMRSEVYLQPGENRGCVGCHEQAQTTGEMRVGQTIASRHAPLPLTPGPEDMAPISYPRLIQPILDRSCVTCHSGENGSLDLRGEIHNHYTRSYISLIDYLRWFEWGGQSIREISTLPGICGADSSPLTKILADENHGDKINLSDEDRRTLYLWMDANAPFYGVYDEQEQARQQAGEKVSTPELQ